MPKIKIQVRREKWYPFVSYRRMGEAVKNKWGQWWSASDSAQAVILLALADIAKTVELEHVEVELVEG